MRRSIRGFIIPRPPAHLNFGRMVRSYSRLSGPKLRSNAPLKQIFCWRFLFFVVNECCRIKWSHLRFSGAAVGWFARMHQTAFTFHFGWIRNFSNMEGIFDGMWGFDVSTEIKNDHDNDDVMIMCILLVNITDFFFATSLTVDTVALWVIALLSVLNCSSEVHSYLHPLDAIKRISPSIKRQGVSGVWDDKKERLITVE